MKIILYIVSLVLFLIGLLITLAITLDPDQDIAVKTLVLFISSLFFIPSFLIFKKNRGQVINFAFTRFVSFYAFSIIFAFGSLMSFINVLRDFGGHENGIVFAIFSILFFFFKKKGQMSASGFASRLQNLKNFELKEFSEQDILDLLGKKITIKKKTQVNVPFKFELELNGQFSAEADKYGFDVAKWNNEVKIENQKVKENEEKKKHYELLYAEYDKALQTYQLAQQTRKAAVINAGLQKKGGGAMLLTAGDKKPKEPAKPTYHQIRKLNKSDFLTNNEGIEKFNDQKISLKKQYAYFNFTNSESFLNIFDFKEYENVKKIINEILALKKMPDFSETNISYDIKSDDVQISFNDNISKHGNILDNSKNVLEECIKYESDKNNTDLIYTLIDQEKYALKNIKFTKYNADYKLRNVSYIPFLRIDYSDKGEDKVAILDYISKSAFY